MRWQYKISLFLLVLSQITFFIFALYHTETRIGLPNFIDETPTIGYSWIWYHPEHWLISFIICLVSLIVFISGLLLDLREANWSLSNFIRIEVLETKEKEN